MMHTKEGYNYTPSPGTIGNGNSQTGSPNTSHQGNRTMTETLDMQAPDSRSAYSHSQISARTPFSAGSSTSQECHSIHPKPASIYSGAYESRGAPSTSGTPLSQNRARSFTNDTLTPYATTAAAAVHQRNLHSQEVDPATVLPVSANLPPSSSTGVSTSTGAAGSATETTITYGPVRKIWHRVTPFPKRTFKGDALRDVLAEVLSFLKCPPTTERTYLSWIRTVLALLAIGLAIPGLLTDASDNDYKSVILKSIGTIFVLLGACGLIYCTIRFYLARKMVMEQRLIYDRYASLFFMIGGLVGVVGCLVIIFLPNDGSSSSGS